MKKAATWLVVVAILVAGLWFLGRPAYRKHREIRSLSRAEVFLAKGDYANASVSARQALVLNPANLGACRVMAELCRISNSRQLLDWRRKIVELSPTLDHKIMLASAALRTQSPPYPLAAGTLAAIEEAGQSNAAFHVAFAELALKTQRPVLAAEHFAASARLEPGNQQHQLNLGVLRLQSTNRTEALEGRAALEILARSTNLGAVALRWLVADRMGEKDWSWAEVYSNQLLAQPGCCLEDRLQHLSLLNAAQKPEFQEFMGTVQIQSRTNAAAIAGLSTWMLSRGLVDSAVSWITSLPAGIQSDPAVALALVECHMAQRDWKRLQVLLEDGRWGEQEFLRFAYLSRTAAELRFPVVSAGHWRSAVRMTGDRLGPLLVLLSKVSSWGWMDYREAMLWQIAQKFLRERWACLELGRAYQEARNTRGLNKVYAAMMRAEPDNLQVRNNFATTSFLLKQGLPLAHEVAKGIYQQQPGNAVFCSTYAYSLHLQGRNKEAIELVSKLEAEELENPSFAVYFAAISLESGQTNQAHRYLELTQKTELLPEEKTLVEAIRRAM